MKKYNWTALTIVTIFLSSFNINAQDKPKTQMHHSNMQMHDSSATHKMMNKNHQMHDMKMNSIVHEGEINLKKIDNNNDGKVFQDMMDWNVIADSAGRCPLCNMKLKEVTIDEAKKNLEKHNFKVR